jgi:hypothetical protein
VASPLGDMLGAIVLVLHVPPAHAWLAAHELSQLPQLPRSLSVSTQPLLQQAGDIPLLHELPQVWLGG